MNFIKNGGGFALLSLLKKVEFDLLQAFSNIVIKLRSELNEFSPIIISSKNGGLNDVINKFLALRFQIKPIKKIGSWLILRVLLAFILDYIELFRVLLWHCF